MTDVEFAEHLADAILTTGVERYAWLVSAANELPPPNSRADWKRFIGERRWEASASGAPVLPADYADRLPPLGGCCH